VKRSRRRLDAQSLCFGRLRICGWPVGILCVGVKTIFVWLKARSKASRRKILKNFFTLTQGVLAGCPWMRGRLKHKFCVFRSFLLRITLLASFSLSYKRFQAKIQSFDKILLVFLDKVKIWSDFQNFLSER